MTSILAVVTAAATLATLFLLYLQVRGGRSTGELEFNLSVMVRLQDVLWQVSDHPASFDFVWARQESAAPVENSREHAALMALLDILSLALAAVDRLPDFSRNGEDWRSYTRYVLDTFPNVRREAGQHPDWWPELAGLVDGTATTSPCSWHPVAALARRSSGSGSPPDFRPPLARGTIDSAGPGVATAQTAGPEASRGTRRSP
jgi:hypothetical protein